MYFNGVALELGSSRHTAGRVGMEGTGMVGTGPRGLAREHRRLGRWLPGPGDRPGGRPGSRRQEISGKFSAPALWRGEPPNNLMNTKKFGDLPVRAG